MLADQASAVNNHTGSLFCSTSTFLQPRLFVQSQRKYELSTEKGQVIHILVG
jgi:hypothetical protein